MITFWILWIFNALMALIPVCFFFIGMSDGSIDARNMAMWLGILAFVGLLLGEFILVENKRTGVGCQSYIMDFYCALPVCHSLFYHSAY